MKLAGDYTLEDLTRALQGNFGCQSVTKTAKGKPLPQAERHIRLELFFLRAEIYSDRVDIYRSDMGESGSERLTKLCSIPVSA